MLFYMARLNSVHKCHAAEYAKLQQEQGKIRKKNVLHMIYKQRNKKGGGLKFNQ